MQSAIVANSAPGLSELTAAVSEHALAAAIESMPATPKPAEPVAEVPVPPQPLMAEAAVAVTPIPEPQAAQHGKLAPVPSSLIDVQVTILELYQQGAAASLAFWSSLLGPPSWAPFGAGTGSNRPQQPSSGRASSSSGSD